MRKVIQGCVTCRRFSTKTAEVPVSPLPEDRVKNAKAFEVTGVDLAGPLFLKDGSKVWLVLYTCAVYRCVHLELVESLSTEDFLLSLVRFIGRRGRPSIVHSDNGTNFVGASNLFDSIDWKKVEHEAQIKRIEWKFIPPAAPWWGGFWERMIRTVKDLLKRMLGNGRLNYVQLETCVIEAEAIVNSRPLTFITEDQEDLIPLTPAMFIQDLEERSFPELENLDAEELRTKFRKIAQLRKDLRQRFRTEYLGLLLQRKKNERMDQFKPGDVVLVGSDNKKRLEWPMAIILELVPGKDGIPRIAWIKTAGGKLLRPLQRLFRLEVNGPVPKTPEVVERIAKDKQQEESKVVVTRSERLVTVPQRFQD